MTGAINHSFAGRAHHWLARAKHVGRRAEGSGGASGGSSNSSGGGAWPFLLRHQRALSRLAAAPLGRPISFRPSVYKSEPQGAGRPDWRAAAG